MSAHDWCLKWHVPPQALIELSDLLTPHSQPVAAAPKSEAWVQNEIRRLAPFNKIKLFRNNSGAMKDDSGRLIRFGLGNDSKIVNKKMKSSDLIGITPWTVKPSDVGKIFGIFTAIECKTQNWKGPKNERERAQSTFLQIVQGYGGIAYFCADPKEFNYVSSAR